MDKKLEEVIDRLSKSMVENLEKSIPTEKPAELKKDEETLVPAVQKAKVDDNSEMTEVFSQMKAMFQEMKKARQEELAAKAEMAEIEKKRKQKEQMQEMAKSMLQEMVKELGITVPAGERKSVVSKGADEATEEITKRKPVEKMTVKEFRALDVKVQDEYVYDTFRKSMGLDDISELNKYLKELEETDNK